MIFLSTLIISMFITMALIPILRTAALRLHAGMDIPNERKVHDHPIPKVGGIAIAAGALVPMLFFLSNTRFVQSVMLGAGVIAVFGLVDDIRSLGWKAKFAGQLLGAGIVVFYGGLKVCSLGECLPAGVSLPDPVSAPLSLLAIVGVTNAINLSDGLDGLAGGVCLLIFIALGFLAYTGGEFPDRLFIMILCTGLAGSIFGFLRFNTYPATVFMGDCGSQLLGFLAITLALGVTQQSSTPLSPLLPILLLGFPVLDTLVVMVERIAQGRSPFHPDKNHLHHKLMRLGLFHTEAVTIIYTITALLAGVAYLLRYHSDWLLIGLYGAFAAAVVAAFAVSEHRGFRLQRLGAFDIKVKGRLKFIKEKQLVIRCSFPVLEYGVPLLFVAGCILPGRIPGWLAAAAAGLAAMVGFYWFCAREQLSNVLRIAFYLITPLVLYLGQSEPGWPAARPVAHAHTLAFAALVFFLMLTLKFTRRQKGFKASPMDFLVVAIALVVPNLPLAEPEPLNLGSLAVKIIVLFFGFDVLVGELRGKMGRLTALVLAGLTILGLRALCGI